MKILEQRYLRGPNLYASHPCLLTLLDLEDLQHTSSSHLTGFNERLLALLPSLREHRFRSEEVGIFVKRLEIGMHMAEVIERLAVELQCLCGTQVNFGTSRPVREHAGRFRVVCAYQLERVGEQAFAMALEIVEKIAAGEEVNISEQLAELSETADRVAIGTSTGAILAAAHRRGIPSVRLTDEANLFQLGWGSKQRRLQATITGATSHVAVGIASDKQLTKSLLEQSNIPVPRGSTFTRLESALRFAARIGGAVTLKPLDANHGRGVTTDCQTEEEITAAFENAQKHSRHVIVERFLEGHDYRVLVTGNTVAAASWRRPPEVTGDGVSTIRALVERENENPARGVGHANILTKIPLDLQAENMARKQGYGLDEVLPQGVTVVLRGNANLSTGGTAEDVTDLLPEETRDICIRAAQKIGLDVAGIDIICKDISQPLREQAGGIIEINAAPGIRMHQYPSRGTPRDAGAAIIDAIYGPEDNGRIPTVAVTGTNGKTTTALLIAHTARASGLRTGCTTTEGIYIDGKRSQKGDCTGYWSARTLLTAPDIDFAVLETARGGILKRGLAFDHCDVSVVLNVSDDHLGLDGIDTVDDLAKVKAVVANAASRAVVLNAEDPYCVRMASHLKPGVEVLYFSMDPDAPVLIDHLSRGGRAVYLDDSELVIADGTLRQGLLRVETMPVSLTGHARYNIANALAAAAALLASNFRKAQIFTGLSSFVSNNRNNPLRTNVYEMSGIKVIVDYAHNVAACAALAEAARSMATQRVVAVITAPGDRSDESLKEMGRVCAAGFDDIVFYESDARGRAYGETSEMILQGARAMKSENRLHCIYDVREALRHARAMCGKGDLLVFSCATTVNQLIDALRDLDPEGVRQVEQVASA